MLGGGASMTIASIWTNIASWSTPSILFCVLNLMVGIIFIASNFNKKNHHGNSQSQLTRSYSLLERVKSVNMSSFYTTQESHDHDRFHNEYSSGSQLSRRSSLLQQVKSIDFSFSNFYNSLPAEAEQVSSTSELTRAPSFMDRVKSFKLVPSFESGHQKEDKDTFGSQDEHANMVNDHELVENHDDTSGELHGNKLANVSEKTEVTLVKRSTSNLTKSRSEKRMVESDNDEEDVDRRRPATMREPVRVNDECVNAKADDFIKRFKQQLKLQRLDSLQRFKDMLNRGTSSA